MRLALVTGALLLLAATAVEAQAPRPAGRPTADTPVPSGTAAPAATPFDGVWLGQSSPGNCNQPMEVRVTVEGGLVDGTGRETQGKTAVLWSYHGRVRADGAVELVATASAFPPHQMRTVKLSGRADAGSLSLGEAGGCARTATLNRGR